MTDYEALNYISDHILGKDFYIEDSISHLQANNILVDTICRRYPPKRESKVDEWRRKHKKCQWCIHCKPYTVFDQNYGYETLYECEAKDFDILSTRLPRPFCKVFELKRRGLRDFTID